LHSANQAARPVACVLAMESDLQTARRLLRAGGFSEQAVETLLGQTGQPQPTPAPAEGAESQAEAVVAVEKDGQAVEGQAVEQDSLTTPQKAGRKRTADSPPSSTRPVCWSLRKYFRAADSPEGNPQAVLVAPPAKKRGNLQTAREKAEELDQAVQEVAQSLPESAGTKAGSATYTEAERRQGARRHQEHP